MFVKTKALVNWRAISLRSKPTGFGWTIITLIALSWLMAINYSNNLLYAVVCLWLSLLVTSGLLAWSQFHRVQVMGWQMGELFADHPNRLILSLQRQGFGGRLHLDGSTGSQAGNDACGWACIPDKPGKQSLQPPPLLGNDTLGLWQLAMPLQPISARMVFACPRAHRPLASLQQARAHDREPENIAGLRDYQQGDDFRHIDWKATARRAAPVTREWSGDQPTAVHALAWDALAGLSSRQKQETLTAWVIQLSDSQQRWSLLLPDRVLEAGSDWQHRQRSLVAIAEVRA